MISMESMQWLAMKWRFRPIPSLEQAIQHASLRALTYRKRALQDWSYRQPREPGTEHSKRAAFASARSPLSKTSEGSDFSSGYSFRLLITWLKGRRWLARGSARPIAAGMLAHSHPWLRQTCIAQNRWISFHAPGSNGYRPQSSNHKNDPAQDRFLHTIAFKRPSRQKNVHAGPDCLRTKRINPWT